eukprot:271948-Chlamydomonas_euryale.AAC.1
MLHFACGEGALGGGAPPWVAIAMELIRRACPRRVPELTLLLAPLAPLAAPPAPPPSRALQQDWQLLAPVSVLLARPRRRQGRPRRRRRAGPSSPPPARHSDRVTITVIVSSRAVHKRRRCTPWLGFMPSYMPLCAPSISRRRRSS